MFIHFYECYLNIFTFAQSIVDDLKLYFRCVVNAPTLRERGGRDSMGTADERAIARNADPAAVEIEQLRRQLETLQLQYDEQYRQRRIVRRYDDISNDDHRINQNTGWLTAQQFEWFVEFLFGNRAGWDDVWNSKTVRYDTYMRRREKKTTTRKKIKSTSASTIATSASTTTTTSTSTIATSTGATSASTISSSAATASTHRRRRHHRKCNFSF